MLLLGHVGITFATALAAESLAKNSHSTSGTRHQGLFGRLHATITALAQRIDLRLLIVGSLLPDIIDKPLGLLVLPGVFGTGRLFAHALLFPLALTIAGVWLHHKRGGCSLLVLAYGSVIHLLLDSMWRTPAILLWPLAGPMPRGGSPETWLARILETLLTNPAAYWPEIGGAILLAPLAWSILRYGGVGRFVRSGVVS